MCYLYFLLVRKFTFTVIKCTVLYIVRYLLISLNFAPPSLPSHNVQCTEGSQTHQLSTTG